MTVVSVTKTIPGSSSFSGYTSGGGAVTITLAGVGSITINTKKQLKQIPIARTKANQTTDNNDKFTVVTLDLKQGSDQILIKGYLDDDATAGTAWVQYWKLRAMCVRGGALTSLVIGDVTFNSSSDTVFLEEVNAVINANDTGAIQTSFDTQSARIEINLTFVVGTER